MNMKAVENLRKRNKQIFEKKIKINKNVTLLLFVYEIYDPIVNVPDYNILMFYQNLDEMIG